MAVSAAGLRARALASANNAGLAKRRSKLTSYLTAAGVVFLFANVFAIIRFASIGSDTASRVAGVLIAVESLVLAALIALLVTFLVKVFSRHPGSDSISQHSAYFQSLGEEYTSLWHETVRSRRSNEQDFELPGFGEGYWSLVRDHRAGLNMQAQQERGVLSFFADKIWYRYAPALLGREILVGAYAQQHSIKMIPYLVPGSEPHPAPVPTVMIDNGRNSHSYMWRNFIQVSGGECPIFFGDVVVCSYTTETPLIFGMSYVETWFPAEHWLVVYPKTTTRFNQWGRMGINLEEAARQFQKHFDVQTDNKEWAKLVLNPAVMMLIMELGPVRFTVDGGRMVLHTDEAWLPAESIDHWAESLEALARSSRAAQAR